MAHQGYGPNFQVGWDKGYDEHTSADKLVLVDIMEMMEEFLLNVSHMRNMCGIGFIQDAQLDVECIYQLENYFLRGMECLQV